MKRVLIGVAIAFAAVWAPACKGGGGGVEVVAGAPAGDVTELVGDVHATRDGKTRALAKGDVIAGDDVVATGADGRITIVLRHNQVPWSLGPNKEKKVADSAAWSAAKGASGETVTDDHSTAAGRHAERSATDTGASSTTTPTMPAPVAAAPAAPAAAEVAPEPEPAPAPAAKSDEAPPSRREVAAEEKEAPPPPPSAQPAAAAALAPAPGAPAAIDQLDDADMAVAPGTRVGNARGGAGGGVAGPSGSGPRGRLSIGEIGATGALSTDAAQKLVRARTALFRACYQRELQKTPSLAGFLSVTISIAADGSISSSKVDGPDDLAAVRSCIGSQLGRIEFPATKGPTTIKAKMVLAPNG